MSRTLVTAVPVWAAALVALVLALVLLPVDDRLGAIPLVVGTSVLLSFIVHVAFQRTDGVVRRLLVTIVGIVVLGAVASGLSLIVAGVG